jgi:DNA-binding HxlR family transcriptional regulator
MVQGCTGRDCTVLASMVLGSTVLDSTVLDSTVPAEPTGPRAIDNDGPASPLDEALRRVGDRWSLLVVNALLDGPRRFNALLDELPGLAPNVLSNRLKRLEQDGVVVASAYSERPPRFSYALSAAGRELAGALRLLADWGAARVPDAEPLTHATCGTPVEARWYCPTCHQVVDPGDATDLRFL